MNRIGGITILTSPYLGDQVTPPVPERVANWKGPYKERKLREVPAVLAVIEAAQALTAAWNEPDSGEWWPRSFALRAALENFGRRG